MVSGSGCYWTRGYQRKQVKLLHEKTVDGLHVSLILSREAAAYLGVEARCVRRVVLDPVGKETSLHNRPGCIPPSIDDQSEEEDRHLYREETTDLHFQEASSVEEEI
jgi:hypothetical protein